MKISIIIPSFNGKTLLLGNLPLVLKACETWDPTKRKWEVLVIDDASTDGTDQWLRKTYPNVKTIRNRKNLRFGGSCNRGVKEAKGEVIILLNNDVQPEADFLQPLLIHFKRSDVFAVGCKEINVTEGKVIFGGRGMMKFQRGLVTHWRPTDQTSKNTSWVSAGSAAYRRHLWIEFGGMDRLFRPAYEEDRDLSWQALKAGYSVLFEPDAIVTHDHETTNLRVFGTAAIKIYSMKNQLLFVWKNISSPLLFMEHLFWLPYHLVFTTLRTKGLFLIALTFALIQIPEVLNSRKRASRYWRRTDEEILALD